MRRALLVSNSTLHGQGYLDHCVAEIRSFLGTAVRRILFVPFALQDRAAYVAKVRERLKRIDLDVDGLLESGRGVTASGASDPEQARVAVAQAEAVFVGGGNTFRLLATLQNLGILPQIRARVLGGMPYIGSSAGSNLACPTIRTTNDMPIVEPRSFEALGLVPFQLNPHYLDPVAGSTHMGETREQRLREYLEENDRTVVGLREGAWLRVEGTALTLGGTTGARIFRRGTPPEEVLPPLRLDSLLLATA
jgi:dipeptidase E